MAVIPQRKPLAIILVDVLVIIAIKRVIINESVPILVVPVEIVVILSLGAREITRKAQDKDTIPLRIFTGAVDSRFVRRRPKTKIQRTK